MGAMIKGFTWIVGVDMKKCLQDRDFRILTREELIDDRSVIFAPVRRV